MGEKVIYLLIILISSTESAYAYIDPGTGSILLQGLIAAVAAGLMVIRLYWQKVKTFLFGRNEKAKDAVDAEEPKEKEDVG